MSTPRARDLWTHHLRELGRSLDERLGALDGWFDRPSDQAPSNASEWSVAQVREHVVLANRYLLLLAEKLARKGERRARSGQQPPAEPRSLSAVEHLASRSLAWSHPEHMTPRGERSSSRQRAELSRQREQVRSILERTHDGRGALHTLRMSVVGERLDTYGFLAVIDHHAQRHLAQLERITRSPAD